MSRTEPVVASGNKEFEHAFDGFDQEAWLDWMDQALLDHFQYIKPYRDEDVDGYMIRIFKSVSPEIRRHFSKALARAIECTPILSSEASRIAILCRVAQVAKPDAASAIRRFLANGAGRFEILEKGNRRSLQNVLLVTAGKYGVTTWLRDFIFSSLDDNDGFDYALLCMRVLVWRLDNSPFNMHRYLVPRFTTESDAGHYSVELTIALKKIGLRAFNAWFQRFAVKSDWPINSVRLWRQGLVLALQNLSTNPYSHMIIGELHAQTGNIDLSGLMALARAGEGIPSSEIVNTLERVHTNYAFDVLSSELAVVKATLGEGAYLAARGRVRELDESSPETAALTAAAGSSR